MSSNILCSHPKIVSLPLFELHCEDLMSSISQRAIELSDQVLNVMSVKYHESNSRYLFLFTI